MFEFLEDELANLLENAQTTDLTNEAGDVLSENPLDMENSEGNSVENDGNEAFEFTEEEIEKLGMIGSESDEDVSFGAGKRSSGWCLHYICTGEFSGSACRGCIGKASNHQTKLNGDEK